MLTRLYTVEWRSTRQIAAMFDVSTPTLRAWFKKYSIDSRTIADAKGGQKPAPQTILASVRSRRRRALPGRAEIGYKITGDGYVLVRDPRNPMADGQGYVREHRLIVSRKLGRPLERAEEVHHENRVRHDNKSPNLHLMASKSDHMKHHAELRRAL